MTLNNTTTLVENPPAYNDADTETRELNVIPVGDVKKDDTHKITSHQVQPMPLMTFASPSTSPFASTSTTQSNGEQVAVYTYKNPQTQETFHSLLPPTHPEIICLQAGEHELKSTYGLLGWIVGIAWFPLGVALCLLDRKVKCKRCGKVVKESWSGDVCS